MPSRSEKQRKFIFAKRGQFKSRDKAPDKWKWVFDKEWEEIEENIIMKPYKRKFEEKIEEGKHGLYLFRDTINLQNPFSITELNTSHNLPVIYSKLDQATELEDMVTVIQKEINEIREILYNYILSKVVELQKKTTELMKENEKVSK